MWLYALANRVRLGDALVERSPMNVITLLAGVGGAAFGAQIFWLIARQRRRWAATASAAMWAGLLLLMASGGNRSRTWHHTVWPAVCVLFAVAFACMAVDGRARRRLRQPPAPSNSTVA
jgi:peptidoglycan/LPS O-acetylase OafA/YrhL